MRHWSRLGNFYLHSFCVHPSLCQTQGHIGRYVLFQLAQLLGETSMLSHLNIYGSVSSCFHLSPVDRQANPYCHRLTVFIVSWISVGSLRITLWPCTTCSDHLSSTNVYANVLICWQGHDICHRIVCWLLAAYPYRKEVKVSSESHMQWLDLLIPQHNPEMLRGPGPNAVVWLHHTLLHNTEWFGAKSDEQAQERGEGWSLQDSCKKESMSQSLLSLLCHPYKKKEKMVWDQLFQTH